MKILEEVITAGCLVFDVGAHAGNKTRAYLGKGATVVCFEPQPWRAKELRLKLIGNPSPPVSIEEIALGRAPSTASMRICDQSDTISTLSKDWPNGRFAHDYTWSRSISVEVETLDRMIEKWGKPHFCKIDVEGYEREVLAGLTQPIDVVSIEFVSEFYDETEDCVARLAELGAREFNMGVLEGEAFFFPEWVSAGEVLARVVDQGGGDIYGRIVR